MKRRLIEEPSHRECAGVSRLCPILHRASEKKLHNAARSNNRFAEALSEKRKRKGLRCAMKKKEPEYGQKRSYEEIRSDE